MENCEPQDTVFETWAFRKRFWCLWEGNCTLYVFEISSFVDGNLLTFNVYKGLPGNQSLIWETLNITRYETRSRFDLVEQLYRGLLVIFFMKFILWIYLGVALGICLWKASFFDTLESLKIIQNEFASYRIHFIILLQQNLQITK